MVRARFPKIHRALNLQYNDSFKRNGGGCKLRTYIKEQEIVKLKNVMEKEICDVCEKEIVDYGCDQNDIKIEARLGANYPECDTRTYYRMDCCSKCFHKVMSTLRQELGVEFTEGRSDEFDYNGDEIDPE